MFSAWAAIAIRSWAAVIMSAAPEQPPHTLPPPGANFCCFRLEKALKPPENVMGTQTAAIFSLAPAGAQQPPWSRDVTEQALCEPGRPEGSSQSSSEHQHISYAGLTPSFLMPKTFLFSPAALVGLWKAPFQPMGFLCSHCPLWRWCPDTLQEPVLALASSPPNYQLHKSYYFLYPSMCKVSLYSL